MITSVMPWFLRSSWIPVTPRWVPATLKSMSPKWSSSPMMSVKQDVPPGSFVLHQADRDAADRIADRHAGVHQAQGRAADRSHRTGAIGLEDVGDHADRIGEPRRAGQDRGHRPLGQRTMPDLAAARSADRPDLADGERGHVVVEHELFAIFVHDAVDPLLVGTGAEDRGHQGLGLAALKQGRAMCPGQQADLALDRPQIFGAAAVGTLPIENQLADDPLFDGGKRGLDSGRRDFHFGRHRAGSGIAVRRFS